LLGGNGVSEIFRETVLQNGSFRGEGRAKRGGECLRESCRPVYEKGASGWERKLVRFTRMFSDFRGAFEQGKKMNDPLGGEKGRKRLRFT